MLQLLERNQAVFLYTERSNCLSITTRLNKDAKYTRARTITHRETKRVASSKTINTSQSEIMNYEIETKR